MQDEIQEALENAGKFPHDPYQKCVAKVLQDYLSVRGKILKVRHAMFWPISETPERKDFKFDDAILVRIGDCGLDDLVRKCGRFLDPEWNAEALVRHPNLDPMDWDYSRVQVFGNSYDIDTGELHKNDSDWEFADSGWEFAVQSSEDAVSIDNQRIKDLASRIDRRLTVDELKFVHDHHQTICDTIAKQDAVLEEARRMMNACIKLVSHVPADLIIDEDEAYTVKEQYAFTAYTSFTTYRHALTYLDPRDHAKWCLLVADNNPMGSDRGSKFVGRYNDRKDAEKQGKAWIRYGTAMTPNGFPITNRNLW